MGTLLIWVVCKFFLSFIHCTIIKRKNKEENSGNQTDSAKNILLIPIANRGVVVTKKNRPHKSEVC